MSVSEQLLNDLIKAIIASNGKKGSITSDELNDKIEKYDLTPEQYETLFKEIESAGVKIVDSSLDKRAIRPISLRYIFTGSSIATESISSYMSFDSV